MKRIAALLMTLLFALTCSASADSYRISFAASVLDQSAVQQQADAIAAAFPEANQPSLSGLLVRLAQNTSVTMLVQEDAAAFDMVLAGVSVLDYAVHVNDAATVLTSSLLPGYALSIAHTSAEEQAAVQDLQPVVNSLESALTAWLATLPVVRTEGVFSGDAYQNGAYCTTCTLRESDIAALFSAMMTEEVLQWLQPIVAAADINTDEFFAMLRAENAAHASDSPYTYVFRLVDDANGRLIGASLTILNGNVQLATTSLGLGQNTLDLVIGLGFAQENYWFDLHVDVMELAALRCDTVRLREFRAPKDETYAYAAAEHAPETWHTWTFSVYEASGKQQLDVLLVDELSDERLQLHGSYIDEPLAVKLETVGLPVNLQYSIEHTDDIVAELPDDLTVLTPDDMESEQFIQAMDDLTKRFAAKMMKLIPIDLLMMFE